MDSIDERIVALLLERSFLTEDQARRVRKAVDRGRRLDEALSRVPLIEPLAFLRATRTAEEEAQAGLSAEETPNTAQVRKRLEEHFEYLRADDDFDDEDLVRIPAPHFAGGEPKVRFETLPGLSARELLKAEREDTLHEAPTMPDGIQLSELEIYNLRDDDGIPFLRDTNALLAELLELEGRGLRLRAVGLDTGEVRYYRANGRLAMARVLAEDLAARFIHRLKIMAKLDPWRKSSATGAFRVQYFRTECCLFLDVNPPEQDSAEMMTIYRM